MHCFIDRPFCRLALAGALGLTLALAGCGRKGPLDPPPGAASATGKQQTSNTDLIRSPIGPAGNAQKAQSSASQAPHKGFILDPLLN
jgi:predicted small lipoprotein YifL